MKTIFFIPLLFLSLLRLQAQDTLRLELWNDIRQEEFSKVYHRFIQSVRDKAVSCDAPETIIWTKISCENAHIVFGFSAENELYFSNVQVRSGNRYRVDPKRIRRQESPVVVKLDSLVYYMNYLNRRFWTLRRGSYSELIKPLSYFTLLISEAAKQEIVFRSVEQTFCDEGVLNASLRVYLDRYAQQQRASLITDIQKCLVRNGSSANVRVEEKGNRQGLPRYRYVTDRCGEILGRIQPAQQGALLMYFEAGSFQQKGKAQSEDSLIATDWHPLLPVP